MGSCRSSQTKTDWTHHISFRKDFLYDHPATRSLSYNLYHQKRKGELFILFVFRDTCLLFWTDEIFCFVLDPATKMWNFSLEDYRQLSKNIKQIFKRKCKFLYSSDLTLIKGIKEVFLLVCVSLLGCSGGSSCYCLGVFEASRRNGRHWPFCHSCSWWRCFGGAVEIV